MAALPASEEWRQGNEEDITRVSDCYCPNCGGGQAESTILPTKIPMFREIVVMNLHCDECGFRSAEVNFGGEIQEKGERITLTVTSLEDLNRQIVKSDAASFLVPKSEFEIPPTTQRGSITTLEGLLTTAADNLEAQQPERLRLGDVDNFHRCHKVIRELRRCAGAGVAVGTGEDDDVEEQEAVFPYQVILDDPSGNSFIENPSAPSSDSCMSIEKYYRTPTQDIALGLQPSQQALKDGRIDDSNPAHKNVSNAPKGTHMVDIDKSLHKKQHEQSLGREEALKFPTICPNCHRQSETNMCVTDIPKFKEIVIMSMLCEHCGYKSNEIKGGGAIPKFGTRITLQVTRDEDLAREVLKSDTAGIVIPELGLELEEGGMDGVYTTTEGLLQKMRERLEQVNPFGTGDAAERQHTTNDGEVFSELRPNHARYIALLEKLKDMADGKLLPFQIIISDPLSNSFIGPIPQDSLALSQQAEREGKNKCYDDYVDSRMMIEEFERTFEQNEVLGLNDMKTENYQQESPTSHHIIYYGTDQMQELLPDHMQRLNVRGPDHPHAVGKAPVKGDTTVMGVGSSTYAVSSINLATPSTENRQLLTENCKKKQEVVDKNCSV